MFLLKYPQLHSQEERAKDLIANEKDLQASTDLQAPKDLQHEAPNDLQCPKELDSAGDKRNARGRTSVNNRYTRNILIERQSACM